MELATRLGLRIPTEFAPLWVVDFPLLEFDEEWPLPRHAPPLLHQARRHAFISNKSRKVRANAYDMVLNGNEIGGGSIRIHDKATTANVQIPGLHRRTG
jgi:aspartyl-tRNA synthetase